MRNRIRSALLAYIRSTPAPPLTDRERWAQCVAEADTLNERILDDLRGESIASAAWRSTTLGDAGREAA
jgi:hypothetical protein